MKIVVHGDPINGLDFSGPFEDYATAHSYAEREHPNTEWWIADLTKPIEQVAE